VTTARYPTLRVRVFGIQPDSGRGLTGGVAAPEHPDVPCFGPDENSHPVFFEGRYSYRKWNVCLVVLLLFITGTWMAALGGWQLFTGQFVWSLLPGLPVVVAWLCLAWLPSIYLGWRILFQPDTVVQIDESGIAIGSRRWKWDEVEHVGGRQIRKWRTSVIVPVFHRRSRCPLKAINGIPAEMSQEQFYKFTERLAAFLEDRFPHVSVG
jgi:hypothetical protein